MDENEQAFIEGATLAMEMVCLKHRKKHGINQEVHPEDCHNLECKEDCLLIGIASELKETTARVDDNDIYA